MPSKQDLSECSFFFFFFDVRWIGCGGGGGGGGTDGGAWKFAPPHFLPNPIHIHVYLYGCGGWRDRQVIQDSAYLARMIIKLARIIFAAYKLINKLKVSFVCFGVLRPSQHYLGYFWAGQLHNRISWVGLCIHKWLTSTVHILSPETDKGPSWISGRERMTPQMYVAPAVFVTLPEKKKKSACKINENGLKIAWKSLSGIKIFRGRPPDPPYEGNPPLILSPSRSLHRSIHAFGSQCPPPPPPVFRPSGGSSPGKHTCIILTPLTPTFI